MSRVNVHIDGLNLYHDVVRRMDGRGKWLDLEAFGDGLAGASVSRVHYFTSRVKTIRGNAGPAKRQQTYLRVVENMARVKVTYGVMTIDKVRRYLAKPLPWERRFPRVLNPSEKGSDVALAVQLLTDAHGGSFDRAIVVTNDSDLAPAIRAVAELGITILIVYPAASPAGAFVQSGLELVQLPIEDVLLAQLPDPAPSRSGSIRKPSEWP